GATTEEVRGRRVLLEELCHEAVEADAAVVRGEMDCRPGGAEVFDSRSEVGGAHAVVQRDLLGAAPGRLARVATTAEKLSDMGQEGGLPDTAGDQADRAVPRGVREPVAERAPDLNPVARRQRRHQPGDLAHHEVNDI